MPYVHYLMYCRTLGCSKPIQLPIPKSHDTQTSQGVLPTDDWKRFFLCFECKRLHEYSGKHVHWEHQDIQSPWELGECRCLSIRYNCDTRNCGTQIEAFAVSGTSVNYEEVPEIFLSWPLVSRQCPRGHWASRLRVPTPHPHRHPRDGG